jgi:hypothetical protein
MSSSVSRNRPEVTGSPAFALDGAQSGRRTRAGQLRGRPGSPRGFYLRYGFTDTGRVIWGAPQLMSMEGAPATQIGRRLSQLSSSRHGR